MQTIARFRLGRVALHLWCACRELRRPDFAARWQRHLAGIRRECVPHRPPS